jgi:ATP-dependent Clp protease ATP-binding subunit ClpB
VLDAGRLTDGQGRVVNFKNTVVIMTSNVGSELLQEGGTREDVLQLLKTRFRPEFLNRLDEITVFQALGREHIRKIVDLQLAHLRKRLADRGITLEVTTAAKDALAKEGYDPAYGARPLKRLIQREAQNPLAVALLEGKFKDGDTVRVDVDRKGKLMFG